MLGAFQTSAFQNNAFQISSSTPVVRSTFIFTNGDVVIDAYERCEIFLPQLEQKHFYTARRQFNLLLNDFSNREVNLWEVVLNSQTLTQGTATYILPSNVVMILDAYRSVSGQPDVFMTGISRDDYASYPNKSMQGPPMQFWFNRQSTPTITTFPTADGSALYTLNYYCCINIQDANLPNGETPNVPNRWFDCLCAGLAYHVSTVYKPEKTASLKIEYDEAWEIAASQDVENVPVKFKPRMVGYYL